ncbi:MAG: hypothetical protein ACI9OU_000334 [Candidatus Promineifilaceae bacterium]|jgi:hypothetical protein
MLTCKKVSQSLEKGDYESLPAFSRMGLKVHVALCIFCGAYNRQRMVMHDLFRKLRQKEDTGELLVNETLSPEARDRIQLTLHLDAPDTPSDNANK